MKSPAFQFYVRDWILSRSVSRMTGDEVKAYLYLLCESWLEEPRATLPNDDEELSRMAQLSQEKWLKVKARVMGCFILKDNRWVNEKLIGVSENQSQFKKWGKMGGNPLLLKNHEFEPKQVNLRVNPMVNGMDNPIVNLASSTSTASLTSTSNKEYIEVLDYLNLKCGKNFQPLESNLKFIRARFNEGFDASKLKAVVDIKCSQWLHNKEYNQYLRPATLFNAEKFASYSGEVGAVKPKQENDWNNKEFK